MCALYVLERLTKMCTPSDYSISQETRQRALNGALTPSRKG